MKKHIAKIDFSKNGSKKIQFDIVSYEDILNKKPHNHNQFEFHKLSFYVIFLCTGNSGKYNLNFTEYELSKGSLFTIRKDNIHKFFKNRATGILLVFTEDFVLKYSNEKEASKTFLLFNEMLTSPSLQLSDSNYIEILNLINAIKKEVPFSNSDNIQSIIRSYLQIIITKLFVIKSEDNIVFDYNKYLSTFLTFQKLIEKECFNHKKVSFYAKELGISTKTLNNITQSIIHRSAKTFINEIVITQSKRLIVNTENTLTEIAYQIGFDDPTNFFKFFKKYTGITPKQFKNSYHLE